MKYAQYLIPALFIMFDIISGILKAVYEGNLSSKSMRKGLFNKVGEILALAFSKLLEFASAYYELDFDIPLFGAVVAYIVTMETLSIIENISALNPSMKQFLSRFMKHSEWRE